MTIGNLTDSDSEKLKKCLPVENVWRDAFFWVLWSSMVVLLIPTVVARFFLDETVEAFVASLKWTILIVVPGMLILRRHHLMDWFDKVWKRNIVGYSLVVEKDGLKHRVVYNPTLRDLRREGRPSQAPTRLVVRLNGGKDWFGAWKVSFAGMDWKDPMVFLTWGPDRIKVSPEWALLNYSHSGTISMVVSTMEDLRREIRQEQKWRYEGEKRQTELHIKLSAANKELSKLRDRLTASHYLHLQVLAQLKDTSRLGKSSEGRLVRSTLAKSLMQLVEEGDEMYLAAKLECNKPVEPTGKS